MVIRLRHALQHHWRALCLSIGAALFLLLGLIPWLPEVLQPSFSPLVAADLNQHRLDAALPPPQGDFRIEQDFEAQQDGLQEIELLLVRWQEEENGRFTLRLRNEDGDVVATDTFATDGIDHNQTHLFRFTPQRQSAQQRYTLEVAGTAGNPLSVWGYRLDVLAAGELTLVPAVAAATAPETAVEELRFTTRYRLTWSGAVQALGQAVRAQGHYLLLALAWLPLPGCLLLLVWDRGRLRWDRLAWWGAAYALGAAAWPLLWYGLTLLGGRWYGWTLWLAFAAGWTLVLWLAYRQGLSLRPRRPARHTLIMLLLLGLGLCLRLLAVRDLALPPWVDSVRHALITAVMVTQGQTPAGYAPYLPIDQFPYHFGFHTLAASLEMMTSWALPDLLLYLGQLLNALVPLTIYAAVWLVTRRARAGIIAAGLVALPFLFPAYYATWGRLTQLTAVLLLPVLLALTWLLVGGGRPWRRSWWLVGILAAGLFLLHFRVFIYYLPFAAVAWAGNRGRNGRYLAAAAGMGLLLVLPRILQLWGLYAPAPALTRGHITGYNAFPTSYLNTGWEEFFVGVSGAGMLLVLLAVLLGRRWAGWLLALVVWVGLLFLSLAGDRVGLPETWLVNLNSMYIILFAPLAILLGAVGERVWGWIRRRASWWQAPAYLLAGGLLTATILFSVRHQIEILNPQTVLAHPADRQALAWLDENLPATARVAVSSWRWLGATWSGSDGGAWLVPLTGLASTTPPADYTYSLALIEQVNEFNEYASAVSDWSDPAQARWLREQDVTHIFVGERGGFFDPAALARNPDLEMVYDHEGVFVFEVRGQ